MKSQTYSRDLQTKHSSREESRRMSSNVGGNLLKKINRSMPIAVPTKSVLLNSHRSKPKVDPIKIIHQSQQISSHHSRKLSINSNGVIVSGRNRDSRQAKRDDLLLRREKEDFLGSAAHLRRKEDVTTMNLRDDFTCRSKEGQRKEQGLKKEDGGRKEERKKEEGPKREHNRSNSAISKKSAKDMKNCFKIDLSRLVGRTEHENRIVLQPKEVNRMHFQYQYVIGKGGFGKVWSVQFKRNHRIYAMKEMLKTKIINKKSIPSVLNERDLLSRLKHPFIVNMAYAFQDRESLYLVMDLLVGGDLRYHMGCNRKFKELEAKFFISCILIGLEFLHHSNIIHRDIKPENLVFDQKGYLRITDLGIARTVKANNSADTSGTPGYMAPEVMCRQDHSFPVDYYAVGVIAYELMIGRRPYYGRNRKEIRDQILSKQVQIKAEEVPSGWSLEAADFINRMIQRKPQNRLGTDGGIMQIKEHPWFSNFPWSAILSKKITSPFIPRNVLDSNDYRDQISSSSEEENENGDLLLLRHEDVEERFRDYKYYSKETKEREEKHKLKEDKLKEEKIRKQSTNAATTTNTHYSIMDEKDSCRSKPKVNNFLK